MFKRVRRYLRERRLGTKWTLDYRDTSRYEWDGLSERLSVLWMDGAGPHSGWYVEVDRQKKDATLVMGNGFVDFDEALLLADRYMADGITTPAFLNGMRQDEWLDQVMPEYEYRIINTGELKPKRPLYATDENSGPSEESVWRMTSNIGRRFEWTDGKDRVRVFWMDGAGAHSGWIVEVNQADEANALVLSNGFVDFEEAVLLADTFMKNGDVIPAFVNVVEDDQFVGHMRQDMWLEQYASQVECEHIDLDELQPTVPKTATEE